MPDLTKRQSQSLSRVEAKIEAKNEEWIDAYCKAGGSDGNAVITAASVLEELRNELVALRAKRNTLLEQYRAEGRNI